MDLVDDAVATTGQEDSKADDFTSEHQQRRQKSYRVCTTCHGLGKRRKPLSRKTRLRYKRNLSGQEKQTKDLNNKNESAPSPPSPDNHQQQQQPPPRFEPCTACNASGLIEQSQQQSQQYNNDLPHIAIVGGGIAGMALAIACQHRGIPHTVLERDAHFAQRRQGYGLTLQQAAKALKLLGHVDDDGENANSGLLLHQDGITSTRHVVHTTDGTVVGEWGLRKWERSATQHKKPPKRQNVHIARQALRYHLWHATDQSRIQWNSRLVQYETTPEGVVLTIQRGNDDDNNNNNDTTTETMTANLLVGSDGIRSQVRQQLIGDDVTPLRYLDCLVVLGICPLSALDSTTASVPQDNELLDGATVFQTADGTTRIYMMPFSRTEYMWQLSFPMEEEEASRMSAQGPAALKDEALRRCASWHLPIPQILEATPIQLVSGYPVYDRALLEEEQLTRSSPFVTLMGDACHPMSPFKGQGANQAMLDALSLANSIYRHCAVLGKKKDFGDAVQEFEREMLERSAVKVKASAEAAKFLHSEVAIQEGNVTRGAANEAATKQST